MTTTPSQLPLPIRRITHLQHTLLQLLDMGVEWPTADAAETLGLPFRVVAPALRSLQRQGIIEHDPRGGGQTYWRIRDLAG